MTISLRSLLELLVMTGDISVRQKNPSKSRPALMPLWAVWSQTLLAQPFQVLR